MPYQRVKVNEALRVTAGCFYQFPLVRRHLKTESVAVQPVLRRYLIKFVLSQRLYVAAAAAAAAATVSDAEFAVH